MEQILVAIIYFAISVVLPVFIAVLQRHSNVSRVALVSLLFAGFGLGFLFALYFLVRRGHVLEPKLGGAPARQKAAGVLNAVEGDLKPFTRAYVLEHCFGVERNKAYWYARLFD